jgi:phosphate transport system ATP-binding protein
MTTRPPESQEPAEVTNPGPTPEPGAVNPPETLMRTVEAARVGPPQDPSATGQSVELDDLHAFYGDHEVVRGVNLMFAPNTVTAIIGPSGCGKSTMVRCINRMHEEIPGAYATGRVLLDGRDVYDESLDVVSVRRAIGMVFQKPNPFPTMSIFDNVAAGIRLTGAKGVDLRERVELSLVGAGLWDEVKDRLGSAGGGLSGGQQQRLCIARSIAVQPDVILMDEPCSALDPIATLRIEELIDELKSQYTIVIVTHNMQQAGRVADSTAFMLSGELVEVGPTSQIFTKPTDDRTEQYVSGRFG